MLKRISKASFIKSKFGSKLCIALSITLWEKLCLQICEGKQHRRGEWPNALYSLRQVTKVKLDRARSNSGWVASEA